MFTADEVRFGIIGKGDISLRAEIQRFFRDNAAAVINADLWFDRTEATAVIAVAQVIAIQPLRDIRVGQPAVGKQGEFAEQLNLLVFLIFRIDIFCAAGIQVQIPIGGIMLPR